MRIYKKILYSCFYLGGLVADKAYAETNCIAYLEFTQGYWQVLLMDEHGNNRKQVTSSEYDKSSLSWYPDSEAMLINSNQGEIYKVDLSTGYEEKVDIGFHGMFDAVLSPDGNHVSFGLSTAGSRDDHNIWMVNLNTKKPTKLTNLKQIQHMPSWSIRNNAVYFSSKTDDQHNDILRVDIDNKRIDYITFNALYNFDAVESANGDILFSSNRSGNYEIWLLNDQTDLKQITNRQARDARPNWSPDGDDIAFESSQGGIMNVWTMQLPNEDAEAKPRKITDSKVGARFPVWSPVYKKGLCD